MEKLIHRMSNALAAVACVCLVVLMLVTFIDVIGRYLFNSPITYSVELIELGMGLTVCFGLAATTLKKAHIAVDMLVAVMPQFLKFVFESIASMGIILVLALMAWRLFERANGFASDGLETSVLGMPVAPVVYCMAFASAVAACIAFLQLVKPSISSASNSGIRDNAIAVEELD